MIPLLNVTIKFQFQTQQKNQKNHKAQQAHIWSGYLIFILFYLLFTAYFKIRCETVSYFFSFFLLFYLYILKLKMHNIGIYYWRYSVVHHAIYPRLLLSASCQENHMYRATAPVSLFSVKTRSHPSTRLSGYCSVLQYLTARLCTTSSFAGNTSALPWFKTGRRSLRAEVSRIELSKDAQGCNKQLHVVYQIYSLRVQRANFQVRSSRDAVQ